MLMVRRARLRPFVLLTLFVCIAGALVAGLFGHLAAMAYGLRFVEHNMVFVEPIQQVGLWWGAGTGLLAAAIWCRAMIPMALRDDGRRLVARGTRLGLAVGILSTVLLHLGLMYAADERSFAVMLTFGLVCGIPSGLIVGSICGVLCRRAAVAAGAAIESGEPPEAS